MRPQRLETINECADTDDHNVTEGTLRVHISLTVAGVMGLFLLMGCGSVPFQYVRQAESGVTLTSLTASPEVYQGKTVMLGGVVVDQKQDGERLWLHLKNRPLDQDYRPHRPIVNEGPEAGYYWVRVTNSSRLPPKWKQWARVTVAGRVLDPKQIESRIGPSNEPILNLVFMRGWTLNHQNALEELVDASFLLSVPEVLREE